MQPSQPAAQAPAGQAATRERRPRPAERRPTLAEANAPRVRLDNGRLHGSVSLMGGRIDHVTLADYRETIDPNSPEIALLSPPGRPNPYFAEFGWVAGDKGTPVPDATTLWQAEGGELTAQIARHPDLGQRAGARLRPADRASTRTTCSRSSRR